MIELMDFLYNMHNIMLPPWFFPLIDFTCIFVYHNFFMVLNEYIYGA